VLAEAPALLEPPEASTWAWTAVIENVLNEGPFGCINNDGLRVRPSHLAHLTAQDASGRPVDSQWFYQPDADEDADRQASLGPFAVRADLRAQADPSQKAPRKSQLGQGKRYWYPVPSRAYAASRRS